MLSTISLLLILLFRKGFGEIPGSPGPLTEVFAIEGGRTQLPCNVTSPTLGDSPILVLFYSGATGLPIYSIDARTGPLGRSIHWSELGVRAHFDLVSTPSGLVIDDVAASDHGHYRCRVDFRSSPTRNLRVKLLVVVPPRRLSILSSAGLEVSGVIGPYPVGGSLALTCQVTGGSPRPWVRWSHEGSLLDDTAEEVTGQVTRNVLTLPRLSRQHLYRVLTCRASNSNMTVPLAATVTLEMSFPPLEVAILGENSPLSEGLRYSLVCEAGGSRPPAVITWWMDGVLMTDTKDQVLSEGNVSRSTLHLAPNRSNNGAVIACRADNPLLDGTALEDARKLVVYYSPRLRLRPGQNLNISSIKEGDDVYFECDIEANPNVFKVQWFLNGAELQQNVTAGVIQSNQSLVLQRVGRHSSGLYTCRAVNIHGTATSNALQLNVKFSPVCSAGQKWVYGGGRHQPVNVTCRVEAYPEATSFRWAFNTSSEFVELPHERVYSGRSRSLVVYTPQTHHDFGSLLCWGRNQIDLQHQPCVFHVVPAGVPEPVHNCSAWHNGSAAGEVVVSCQAGWSGGLSQSFTLEVRHAPQTTSVSHGSPPPGNLLASLKNQPEPHFTVTGLAPGTEYHLVVVASNAQGPAVPVVLGYFTPIDVAEKQTSAAAAESPGPNSLVSLATIVGVVVGVVASLLVCSAVLVVVVVRARASHTHSHSHTKIVYDKASAATVSRPCDEGGFVQQQQQKQQGPDIILVKSESHADSEAQQELLIEYRSGHEGSFHINPGHLITTVSTGIPRETDALLEDTSSSVANQSVLPPEVSSSFPCPSLTPSCSASFLPSIPLAQMNPHPPPFTSFFPEDCGSPPSPCPRSSPGEPLPRGQPDLCPKDTPTCAPVRTMVVTCSQGGNHESSV
ncbi:neural cell adhesion molecule 1-B-like [Cherax quadricarinatus]|uniref:neural cell adhesion molecule 1-B-like n=1 Tax=Cherax quadricarinatus TaxID=27406 RepID=UPI00387EC7C3